MATDVRIMHAQDFFKATVQGQFDLPASRLALLEIARAAPPTGINLMIDIREAPADMNLVELTQLVEEFSQVGLGARRKTAVLTEDRRIENARFFAVSARGKGNNVQAFTSFEEAFDWLAL